jgi:hypothetical protein
MGNSSTKQKEESYSKSIKDLTTNIKAHNICFTGKADKFNKAIEPIQESDDNVTNLKLAMQNFDSDLVHSLLDSCNYDMFTNIKNFRMAHEPATHKIEIDYASSPVRQQLKFLQAVDKISRQQPYKCSAITYTLTGNKTVDKNNRLHFADLKVAKFSFAHQNMTLLACIGLFFKYSEWLDYDIFDKILANIDYSKLNIIDELCLNMGINNGFHDDLLVKLINYDIKIDLNNKSLRILLEQHKKTDTYNDAIDVIISTMVDATLTDNIQGTWLHYIAHTCAGFCDTFIETIINDLIAKGCNVNYLTNNGASVLHLAVKKNNVRLVEYLLNNHNICDNIVRDISYNAKPKTKKPTQKRQQIMQIIENYINVKKAKDNLPLTLVEMEARVAKMRETINNLENDADNKTKKCEICYDQPIGSFVITPCGHRRFCDTCISILKTNQNNTCPLCKTVVHSYVKIY